MIEQAYASGFGPLSEGGKNYKMYIMSAQDNIIDKFSEIASIIKNAPMHSTFILGSLNYFSASGSFLWGPSAMTATITNLESEDQLGILPVFLYTNQVFPYYTELSQEDSLLILSSSKQEFNDRVIQVLSKYQS